jgi:hypothetical protein
MVFLTRAQTEFHARVLVAKLGSAGILSEVHGLCSPYPTLADAEVWVEAEEFADASELLSVDLDDVLAADDTAVPSLGVPDITRAALIAIALLLLGTFALALPR